MNDDIDPNNPIVIAGGTGVWSRGQLNAFIGQVLAPAAPCGNTKLPGLLAPVHPYQRHFIETCITNPERDAWNAAVDAKKAAKKARKAAK